MEPEAKVLNGTVKAGDRVAYGANDDNKRAGIRVGVVHEVCANGRLKIAVELSSARLYSKPPHFVSMGVLNRVVKL
jgi:hypothetical protein